MRISRVEALRLAVRREHGDHAADRVRDEDTSPEVERMADVQDVVRVAVEAAVALRIVGGQVGAARAPT